MNPAVVLAWVSVIADLIKIGKVTYDEIASLFKGHTHGTDLALAGEDDLALAQLQILIASYRAKAAAEAGLPPTV